MDIFDIAETEDSPRVYLNAETGKCEISGNSYLVKVREFYLPVFDWLDEFGESRFRKLDFTIRMSYYNTASSKLILTVIQILDELTAKRKDVTLNWCYPEADEDLHDAGSEYGEDLNLKFNLIPY